MKFSSITGKISPEQVSTSSFSLPERQGDPRRKNLWFKGSKSPLDNEIMKQPLKKRQTANRDKKVSAGSIFEKQPATPHNTTQFITNFAHFSTEPCIFNSCGDRFSQQIDCHSMLGSMRNLVFGDRLNSDLSGIHHESPPKDLRGCFPENAYDLTKIRSESDIQLMSHPKNIDQSPRAPSFRPAHQASQIDIKQLLEEISHGRNNLENVIKGLVNEIKEKEDIIVNLRKQSWDLAQ